MGRLPSSRVDLSPGGQPRPKRALVRPRAWAVHFRPETKQVFVGRIPCEEAQDQGSGRPLRSPRNPVTKREPKPSARRRSKQPLCVRFRLAPRASRLNKDARSRSPDEAAKITPARVVGPRTRFYRIRTAFSRITFPPARSSIRYTPVGSSRPASSRPSQRRE